MKFPSPSSQHLQSTEFEQDCSSHNQQRLLMLAKRALSHKLLSTPKSRASFSSSELLILLPVENYQTINLVFKFITKFKPNLRTQLLQVSNINQRILLHNLITCSLFLLRISRRFCLAARRFSLMSFRIRRSLSSKDSSSYSKD